MDHDSNQEYCDMITQKSFFTAMYDPFGINPATNGVKMSVSSSFQHVQNFF